LLGRWSQNQTRLAGLFNLAGQRAVRGEMNDAVVGQAARIAEALDRCLSGISRQQDVFGRKFQGNSSRTQLVGGVWQRHLRAQMIQVGMAAAHDDQLRADDATQALIDRFSAAPPVEGLRPSTRSIRSICSSFIDCRMCCLAIFSRTCRAPCRKPGSAPCQTLWQAASRPGATSRNSGFRSTQPALATGQRRA
jgi:hypothetical protein